MMSQPNINETCILVAEVIGDNPLLDKIGRDETLRAVERSRKRAERSVDAYRGFVVTTEGRRLVAHFPRGENAILAAFDMRTRVKQLPPVSGVALSIHVVIHAASLDANSNLPDEEAVRLAGKLVMASPANQILATDEALEHMPEAMSSQMTVAGPIMVAEYGGSLHEFAEGVVPTASGNASASLSAGTENFSPTSTSLSLHQGEANDASPQAANTDFPAASHEQPRTSLILRHNGNNLSVSDNHPVVLAGREEGNDLVVIDRRASRHHARIEWRQNHFVLIDTSTNGTFLVDQAGNEVVLRRGEADLPAKGRIGFGYSPMEVGAEVVFFDIGQK